MGNGLNGQLINKEVINIKDGSKIGCISDVSVDCKSGCVCSIIVPVVNGIFSFVGKKKEYCIIGVMLLKLVMILY